MILSFSTQLNGKPTYFVEKIWEGLLRHVVPTDKEYISHLNYHEERFGKQWDFLPTEQEQITSPKLHTIREDKNARWKVGTEIDFFINCRQKNMFRFAPVLPVVSTQKILITYTKTKKAMVFIDDKCFYMQDFSLEGNHKMLHLAQNDGFDTIEDFFAYFNEDFTGKIIHWTDLRY
jgi:hypothetical protein